ncbi:Murein DD-endopeptidase MepM and murein hydrolase activator NlpD, contain LysM domain [Anaerobranca californiensis DSM 14826]|uniref:Murein DD-endopeptidase MepM and murein hydrolase activator NlpD, contain LysM domain n=1 Tax=Anaerobranca californiensis DSM 14826 TaxID=1120989 RepID=A0A1M6M4B8_9FIRM|nr:Murein DD-endopeptidase MepM and murein hydrolase activator NlpD, contain LysM domain [Anaerobranca californiensis DSM 14826]
MIERGESVGNGKIPHFTALKNLTQWQIGVVSLIITAVILTIGYIGYNQYQPGYVYAVTVDGQEVGIVKNLEDLERIIEHLTNQETLRTGYDVVIVEEITTERVFQLKPQEHLPNLQYKIAQLVSYESAGTLIIVEGKPTVVVESQEVANKIIEEILQYYITNAKGNTVKDVEILNDVKFSTVAVRPDEIMDYEGAKNLLLRGTPRFETYQVSRGDNLLSIARMANMTVEELKAANGLNSDLIKVGQELKLTTAEPLLNVKIVKEESKIESIPYTTQWKYTSNLFTWQTRVHTPGKPGQREVKYEITLVNGVEVNRVEISNKVVAEPVTRIAERGTATLPSRGTGMFRWPVQYGVGVITSHFGNRIHPRYKTLNFHTGVDIASSAGTPIYAAAGGRVVASGDRGNYGNLIIIDHGNGYTTYYAHLQSMSVKVGDRVSQGQIIGRMGRTGLATGVHLHFEIRRNGTPLNPMNFFAP